MTHLRPVVCLLLAVHAAGALAEDPFGSPSVPSTEQAIFGPAAATNAPKVAEALDRAISMDVSEKPLVEVVADLARQADVPFQIDKQTLLAVGIGLDTPVSRTIREMRLRSLLKHVLRDLDLAFTVRAGVIVITTPEEVNAALDTRLYPVKELVEPDLPFDKQDEEAGARYDYDTIIDLITSCIAPTTWGDGNNDGMNGFGTWLVVPQTDEVHEQIAELLAQLKAARQLWQPWDGKASVPKLLAGEASLGGQSREERRIRKSLAELAKWDFINTKLEDAMDSLSQQHKIPIVLDRKALSDVGVGVDSPLRDAVAGVPLDRALTALLKTLDLVYVVHDDALVVTTDEEARISLQTRSYPVFDLVEEFSPPLHGGGHFGGTEVARWDNSDQLLDVLRSNVRPHEWDDVGGQIAAEYMPPARCLVISAPAAAHDDIERMLAKLRAAVPIPRKFTAAVHTEEEAKMVERAYVLGIDAPDRAIPEAKELAELIRTRVAPETWKNATHSIIAVRGRLLVTAPRSVHRKIAQLLVDLDVAPRPPMQQGLGGFQRNP